MARIIGIMGESGAGKTTSMRNLDPATTYYIDCDKKGLSWRGWKKQYNAEAKNYFSTDKQNEVLAIMQGINDKRPNINAADTNIIIRLCLVYTKNIADSVRPLINAYNINNILATSGETFLCNAEKAITTISSVIIIINILLLTNLSIPYDLDVT